MAYKCYHWTKEDKEKNGLGGHSIGNEKETCESNRNFVYSQGDEKKAPGCGNCWCCQPDYAHGI